MYNEETSRFIFLSEWYDTARIQATRRLQQKFIYAILSYCFERTNTDFYNQDTKADFTAVIAELENETPTTK